MKLWDKLTTTKKVEALEAVHDGLQKDDTHAWIADRMRPKTGIEQLKVDVEQMDNSDLLDLIGLIEEKLQCSKFNKLCVSIVQGPSGFVGFAFSNFSGKFFSVCFCTTFYP